MFAMKIILVFQLVICFWSAIVFGAVYQPPRAKVEPIHPRGLRMSIPDASGISLVAFHANINEDFNGLEAGFIARDIVKVRNGRWTYQDRTTELQKGDIIYYWLHVVYNGLGYNLIDQQHQVSDFYDLNGSKVEASSPTDNNNNCDATETVVFDGSGNLSNSSYCSGSLIFYEDFGNSDNRVNESAWMVVEQFSDAPSDEFNVYRNSPANVKLKNGKLKITPTMLENDHGATFVLRGTLTLTKCTGRAETPECKREARGSSILPPVSSGQIDTRKSFAFTYGRILIRAKLPHGDWIYPVISLKPLTRIQDFERMLSDEGSPVEMRVVSSTGNSVLKTADGRDVSGHMIWGGIVNPSILKRNEPLDSGKSTRFSDTLWSDNFHDYELEWRPRSVILKVDNVQYDFRDVDMSLDKPYYVSIGLAVGGLTDFPDMSQGNGNAKPWRNVASKAMLDFYNARGTWKATWDDESSLEVDYVKVYAL